MTKNPINDSTLVSLGKRIREARKSLHWSQEDLAYRAELDRSYIGGIERGERNISFISLTRIARALGKDISFLTKGIPNAQINR